MRLDGSFTMVQLVRRLFSMPPLDKMRTWAPYGHAIKGQVMVTEQNEQKVTYTTMSVGQAQRFHERFDTALAQVMRDVGEEYPVYIADEARTTGREPFQSVSPNDVRCVVGTFQECREPEADAAVAAARNAYRSWGRTPWQERVRVLRRAATNFRDRKYDIASWLSLEAGKPRLEAMGEVEEAGGQSGFARGEAAEADGLGAREGQLSWVAGVKSSVRGRWCRRR